jgi:Asp/Glu/hydantoin racemase
MTAGIEKAARDAAAPAALVRATHAEGAPPAIEGYGDEALAVPLMLALAEVEADQWDAIIVACHSDRGLEALRAAPESGCVKKFHTEKK